MAKTIYVWTGKGKNRKKVKRKINWNGTRQFVWLNGKRQYLLGK